MAWATGTITSATPHVSLSTAIKNLFGGAGVVNWSFVEAIPAGTGVGQSGITTFTVDVYKCSGTGTDANSAGINWFIGFGIPVTDGAVSSFILVAEDYLDIAGNPTDASRGMFKRPAAGGNGTAVTTVPTGTGYWVTDTYGNWNSYSTASIKSTTQTLNTTGFTYYIKLTNNLLIVSTLVGAADHAWLGMLLDSMTSVSDPMALVVSTTTTNLCGPSRLPLVVSSAITDMWRMNCLYWTRGPNIGTSNAANTNDFWQGNKIHVSRGVLRSKATTVNWYLVGLIRGLMKSDILMFLVGGTVGVGDTMVIGADTWTVISTSSPIPGESAVWIVRAN